MVWPSRSLACLSQRPEWCPRPRTSKAKDDYLGDVDLPSSSSEDEEGEERHKPLYTAEEKDKVFTSMVRSIPAGQSKCCGM